MNRNDTEVKIMKTTEALRARRTYYNIKKEIPADIEKVNEMIRELTELVPDAFNMKSSRIVVAEGEMQDRLWDTIYEAFAGKVKREKIDSFSRGAGTILYFYDRETVERLQKSFPEYAQNFPVWANQASAMLQLAIWSGLRELGIGASLQHYNPVIDKKVKELLDIPKSYELVAQMPFGGIVSEPEPKEREDIAKRVRIVG